MAGPFKPVGIDSDSLFPERVEIRLQEAFGSGGASLPSGGTTGQALVKASNADNDVQWASVGGGSGLPNGGTTGQLLRKNSNSNGDAGWTDAPNWGNLSGRPVVVAGGVDAAAARASIGAGTSNLTLGTGAEQAAPGNHTHAGMVISENVVTLWKGTQVEYDALVVKPDLAFILDPAD